MDNPDQNQIQGFLRLLDGAIQEGIPRRLLNCSIRSEFLRLIRLDKLEEFQRILDSYRYKPYIADIARKFQDEIVYRYLVGVPRDFSSLSEFLEERFPADSLTGTVNGKLVQVTEANTKDWIEQEIIFLSELQQLKDKGSRFEVVIKKILNSFLPEVQNKASIHAVFVRSSGDRLAEEYLRPAIVRKIATVGAAAGVGESIFFLDPGIIGDELDRAAKAIQLELTAANLIEHPIQYNFLDSLIYWDEFHGEGRSASLAFAYLSYAYKHRVFRNLSPYIACFGSYQEELITGVEQIRSKVDAAKETGVRVLIVSESDRSEVQNCRGCEIIEYPIGTVCDVLNHIFERTTSLAEQLERVQQETRKAVREPPCAELFEPRPPAFRDGMITWSDLVDIARLTLKQALGELEGDVADRSKFIAELYVRRSEIESQGGIFDEFLASDAPLLPILGESGHGKTNLMCSLTRHRSLRQGYALLFYEARNLYSGFEQQICQTLNIGGGLEDLIESLNGGELAGRKMVVFLDAVNEFREPAELIKEILGLCVQQRKMPAFRIVFSCRTITWSQIRIRLTPVEEALLFHTPDNVRDRYPTVSIFTDDELQAAYRRYAEVYQLGTRYDALSAESRQLLKDPMILRFAAEAYSGRHSDGRLPTDLDIQKVFEIHDNSRVITHGSTAYAGDERFLENLISCMWKNRTERLEKEIILKEHDLFQIVYQPPEIGTGIDWVCGSGHRLSEGFIADGICPICRSHDIQQVQVDHRTTYIRLREEGLLAIDGTPDEYAVRFAHDRYYEYRTARWLVEQNQGELTGDKVRELAMYASECGSTMPLEALKQALLMVPNRREILLELAKSEEQMLRDMVEACIVSASRRGDQATAGTVLSRLTEIGGQARLLAIRAARDAGVHGDPLDPLLAPIRGDGDSETLRQAVTQALYGIWRRRDGRERALGLMQAMAESVSPWKLVRGNSMAVLILLDVTLRTLGVLHNEADVVRKLGRFWQEVLTHNLCLGRRGFPSMNSLPRSRRLLAGALARLLSFPAITRWAFLNVAAGQVTKKLEDFGMSSGKVYRDFTDAERNAIVTLLDALAPGNEEAFAQLPETLSNYGLEAVDPDQRGRLTAIMVSLLSVTGCAVQAGHDFADTVHICDGVFEKSKELYDSGRGTRYYVYSGLNYAIQIHYPILGPEMLQPGLVALLRYYRWALEKDRESMIANHISKESRVPYRPFGIFFQAVTRMGGDLNRDIVEPMLAAAEQGCPDLIKAYLRGASGFCLDTFSCRYSAHLEFLRSLDLFSDFEHLASRIDIGADLLMRWVVEAYAVISVGFPSDVELFILQNRRLDRGILSRIREVRSRPSYILNTIESNVTLEQEISRNLELWSLADGINELVVLFPKLRGQLVGYMRGFFGLRYNSLKDVLQDAMKDLLDYLMILERGR